MSVHGSKNGVSGEGSLNGFQRNGFTGFGIFRPNPGADGLGRSGAKRPGGLVGGLAGGFGAGLCFGAGGRPGPGRPGLLAGGLRAGGARLGGFAGGACGLGFAPPVG